MPKARRAKLDLVWSAGIYLGTTLTSNEAYVGLPDGSVTRARAITRIRPDQRWRPDLIQRIVGTPQVPSASGDDSIIEAFANPNVYLDQQQIDLLEREDLGDDVPLPPPSPEATEATLERAPPRLRIIRKLFGQI